MPKYNLDALGHEEFEHLCQGLVQQIIGPGAKIYGMGRDGAREATFHGKALYPSKEEQWDGSWIFQVKFHDIQQIGSKKARSSLLIELDDELSKITKKYKHHCDNFILMTNVPLTPVFQKGIKDKIDNKIIPKYCSAIKHIHIWGAEEICRFLDANPGIRQTYASSLVSGDIIARLLKLVEKEETDLDELVKLYCNGCFDHEQYAVLDDAGDLEDKRIALQRIFIDLDIKPPMFLQDRQMLKNLPESPKLPGWLKQAAEDGNRTSALSYLFDDSIPGVVLIGGPGEGKSTLCQYLAQIHRGRLTGHLKELGKNTEDLEKCIPRIPFRILLKEYAQWIFSQKSSDSLFYYLAIQSSQKSGREVSPEDIQRIVKSNPILLILDGLDEVPEKKLRNRVLDNTTSFVHQVRDILKGNLRVIATTRPYGYSQEFDPLHYLHLTIQKLLPEKASLYAKYWTNARELNLREAERIQDTFNLCLEDKVVSVLTQTPLQITILLIIIRARGTPPKQREELFEGYMNIIYQREQKKRPELLRTGQDIIYGLHKYLAYILHKRAEKDKTAALMDISEFRERVEDYLVHSNSLLNKKEIKIKVNQIITEARQRLVLIVSSQEGKVGFGLTTTREFFAAAHLVDTAKDTKERDSRFKAIAKSPYWRNVALFFAGRVGRTRPGEAPSMINVCRENDRERVDKFLKRGAELVMEMIDDRVLREPHNEAGAIEYGLTLLDSGIMRESNSRLLEKLKNLSDQYKERVICPWIEKQLNSVIPENLKLYVNVYQKLLGFNKPLYDAIKRASESDSKNVKLWVLSQAIRNKIAEVWVIELFEELINIISVNRIARTLANYWYNFRFYLNFSLSPKARAILALGLLRRRYSKDIDELFTIKPEGKIKENLLLFWAVSQLSIVSHLSVAERGYRRRNWSVEFCLPDITNPAIRAFVDKNASFIKDFCETFSKENEPLAEFLVAVFEFLLEPHNPEKYINISKQSQEKRKLIPWFRTMVPEIIEVPEDEDGLLEYHKNLCCLYKYYKSKEQYGKDIKDLNELINKNSKNIKNHRYKLFLWINSGCDPTIEKFLDTGILSELKQWLRQRDLTESVLHLRSITIISDLELCGIVLEIVEKQLAERRKRLRVNDIITYYEWHKPKTKQELMVAKRLEKILQKILANYSALTDPDHRQIEVLYWSALKAEIVEEKWMTKLYKIFHASSDFPSVPWFAEVREDVQSTLVNMLQSDKLEVARLAAVSLLAVLEDVFFSHEHEPEKIKEVWVGDKYWEFAQDKEDAWRSRYIEGMAQCCLKWAENDQEFLKAIKEANTEKLQNAWRQVIEEADYCNVKDRDAFFNSLLRILESENSFTRPIRFAALRRLREIISEIEPVGFDEKPLNLPLSERARG